MLGKFGSLLVAIAAVSFSCTAEATVYSPLTASGGYNGTFSIVDTPNIDPVNSWYIDQVTSSISGLLTSLGISDTSTVSDMSAGPLSSSTSKAHSVTVTGAGANVFAIHFGGGNSGQELVFEFASLLTSFELTLGCPAGSSSCDGKYGLISISAFDSLSSDDPPLTLSEVASIATTPLPGAAALFAGGIGLGGLLLGRRRKRKTAN